MELCITVKGQDYVRIQKEHKSHKCDMFIKGNTCPRTCADNGVLKKVRTDARCFLKFRYQGETIKFNRDECLRRFSVRKLIPKVSNGEKLDSFQLSREAYLIIGKYKLEVPAGWHILITESGMRCISDELFKKKYDRHESERNFYSSEVKIKKNIDE